jgi:serine/threonine-protein kinase RsbW
MPFAVSLSLCLPRDGVSVPVVRHICRFALQEFGVGKPCIADIELALTEACTNVLDHATGDSSYEVFVDIAPKTCTIRVKDTGGGFEQSEVDATESGSTAESGRGLGLMRALVDDVKFVSMDGGMTVELEKVLEFDEQHPVGQRLR